LRQQVIEELIRRARAAYKQAYVPYSHYPVGAAAIFAPVTAETAAPLPAAQDQEDADVAGQADLDAFERIYSGCNVENASYGLTVCAERNAIFQAVARGHRVLEGIAIAVPTEDFPSPCGACRQVMREFAVDCPVVLVNGRGEIRETTLRALLPDSFGPEFLPGK